MPFDYTLTEDEKAKYAGKLQDKHITVGAGGDPSTQMFVADGDATVGADF